MSNNINLTANIAKLSQELVKAKHVLDHMKSDAGKEEFRVKHGAAPDWSDYDAAIEEQENVVFDIQDRIYDAEDELDELCNHDKYDDAMDF